MEMKSNNDEWNKKFLESLLYSNSDRLAIKANDKGKNPFIWSQFQIAYIDGIEQKYACCKFCKTFIKYTGRTGTGGLMRHLCFKKLNPDAHPRRRRSKSPSSADDEVRSTKNTWVRLRLEGLMNRNSPRIGYVENTRGKSDIWSQFRILTVDNILSKFACCMLCRSIVTYTSRTGTGSMMRHKCHASRSRRTGEEDEDEDESEESAAAVAVAAAAAAAAAVTDPNGDPVVIKTEDLFDWDDEKASSDRDTGWTPPGNNDVGCCDPDGLPEEVERVLQEKHLAVLNKSVRLFDVYENEEFLELAQFLVNLGARYGPMDVKNLFKRKMNLVTLNQD